ncbi:winged helix-turn-helix transcriptional regulator [Arthrobacter sp. D3-16]
MSARHTYPEEFKIHAVTLAAASDRPLPAIAADLGISLTTLRRWVGMASRPGLDSGDQGAEAAEPLRDLSGAGNRGLSNPRKSSKAPVVEELCPVAPDTAKTFTGTGSLDPSPEMGEKFGSSQSLGRVRTVLGSSAEGREDSLEYFEYFCGQLDRYQSTRNNPIVSVVDHIGNYWRNWLLMIARTGPYRPSTIRRLLAALDPTHPISQRMLTLNLRLLERDGLIARHVIDHERRHVEYSLTPLGRGLSDKLLPLIEWIDQHGEEIATASEAFDRKVVSHQYPTDSS